MNQPRVIFLLKWATTLILLIGGALFLEPEQVENAIADIGWRVFLITVLLVTIGSIVLPAVLTREALFRSQIRMSLVELVALNLCMRFYNLILPRALAMAIRWQRYRARGDAAAATALMIFERVVQVLVYSLAALGFLILDTRTSATAQVSLWMLIALTAITLVLLLVFVLHTPRQIRAAAPDETWWRRALRRLWTAVRVYRELSRAELARILLISISTYVLLVTSAWVIADSMGLDLSWTQLAWVRTVVFLLTMIPLTIGGMGVRELGFVGLLSLSGVTAEAAFTLGLSLSAAQLIIGLAGAIVELRQWLSGSRGASPGG